MKILEIFNTRELAAIIWATVIFGVVLIKSPSIFKSIFNILKTACRLWNIFLIEIIYIVLCIFVLYKLSLWNFGLLKVTIYWFFGWALIMFMHSSEVKDKGYLKKTLKEILGLTVLISFVANFYTFPLPVELVLWPIITLLAVSLVMPQIKNSPESSKVVNWMLIIFGFVFLFFNFVQVIVNFKEFATMQTLLEFLTPILLSLSFLPFLYIFYLYSQHGSKKKMSQKNA